MFVSAIYASLLALLLVVLAVVVIRVRRKNKIAFADGGINELTVARSAHANASEYIPIALILMFALEFNVGHSWLLHAFGILFLAGRMIHAYGILREQLPKRVLGMALTFITIVGLAAANFLAFLPF
ncbi:MAPEG family protein [Eionea flava]